ncbi:tryptophan-rich sensory protein [Enterococcus saigonensis]|uniref:Tryptophan-rich sensory protein n=1 Tax=Enterococcus saigonensis TaxID=1805431 RepID=A0A679IFH2_9ENTE|nr:TspO/MBR family protein [Enterococcus saigonensis]BCA86883.1 tryptophan-rich sensory protein [Enterococcus saigonensis]
MRKIGQWLLCVVGVEAVGVLSGLFAGDSAATYAKLNTPPFSPPGNIIGIIWTILYGLIGTALFFILDAKVSKKVKNQALFLFALQLILNFIWSIVFFGGENFFGGVVIVLLLLGTVFACLIRFYSIQRLATFLFTPYFIWCVYAAYLAIGLAIKN